MGKPSDAGQKVLGDGAGVEDTGNRFGGEVGFGDLAQNNSNDGTTPQRYKDDLTGE